MHIKTAMKNATNSAIDASDRTYTHEERNTLALTAIAWALIGIASTKKEYTG